MSLIAIFRSLFRREKLDAEMRAEMTAHLEAQTQRNLANGMSPDEARAAARQQFGGVAQIQERARDARGLIWLEQLAQDVRYAVRQLARAKGFTAAAVLTLALGIGANTAIFSLVNEFLLRSLSVRDPDELVLFRTIPGAKGELPRATEGNGFTDPTTGRYSRTSFSLLMFERFQANHPALAAVFAFAPLSPAHVLIDGQPEVGISTQLVSGGYHEGLGVSAQLGRALAPNDDESSASPVAVISDRYWQNRFGRDPGVLGRTILLNKIPVTIVGVTAPGFSGTMQAGDSTDISVPLAHMNRFQPDQADKLQPWFWWLRIMGRLAPGMNATQASASLQGIHQESAREGWRAGQSFDRTPRDLPDDPTLVADPGGQGENDLRRQHAKSLHILMGLAGLVLLAACANVANLLLARGAGRRREITVRLALGASRGRIVRQLLVESLLLASLGAAVGTAVAWWGRGLLVALRPFGNAALVLDLPLDARVLSFTIIAAGVTALLFGLTPALRVTRLELSAGFSGGTRALGGSARSRLSQTLMVVQIALSLVLLVSTGLFVRTLHNLQNVDPGFNRHGLVLFRIEPRSAGYQPAQFAALHERLRTQLEQMPGVKAVTLSEFAMISGRRIGRMINVPGYTSPTGRGTGAMINQLAPNFLAAMEMPLVLGRGFTEHDNAGTPKVAVVNQAFVNEFFRDENPIGRNFMWTGGPDKDVAIEIVGVTRDAKFTDLRDKLSSTIYTPMLQAAEPDGIANFALRVTGDPAAVFSAIRAAVREIDSTLPVLNLRTQDEQIDRLNARPLLFARFSGFFGALALGLACVGLYGLMSYQVLRRTNEIGLRMALGALPAQVLRMILRDSLRLIGLGVAFGVAVACAASRIVASMLFGLAPTDALTYGSAALLLVMIALAACLLPARRAAKVDPNIALRAD